jgi:hypothetical protein
MRGGYNVTTWTDSPEGNEHDEDRFPSGMETRVWATPPVSIPEGNPSASRFPFPKGNRPRKKGCASPARLAPIKAETRPRHEACAHIKNHHDVDRFPPGMETRVWATPPFSIPEEPAPIHRGKPSASCVSPFPQGEQTWLRQIPPKESFVPCGNGKRGQHTGGSIEGNSNNTWTDSLREWKKGATHQVFQRG